MAMNTERVIPSTRYFKDESLSHKEIWESEGYLTRTFRV